ncbi:TIM barrel protein [Priestia sp. SB1]|uniref:TIM barrel protein n=1 Tax=Priestia aryabhattai TaxID=412384 RepID=A0AAX6NDK5_PRIAR|nr:TIM barrel protein [Priestia aryabhattai]MDU9693816.1 TIM barrel protein [Priestia aryabhattai]
MMRIGFHFPFSGGLKKLKERISSSRGNTFQIFARGLRGGTLHELNKKNLNALQEHIEYKNIKPVILHAPYVYNLANLESLDEEKVLEDLEYAKQFRAPYYVVHPGYYTKQHPLIAMENVKYQLWDILNKTDWMGQILVKNMRGAGTEMAADLREWRELITFHPQVKGALDLSRAYVAGYNFIGEENSEKFYCVIEDYIGWENIKVIYINDTHYTLGSRRDDRSPPPLGEGTIGFVGYRHILSKPKVKEKIWIVENSPDASYYLRTIDYLLRFFD